MIELSVVAPAVRAKLEEILKRQASACAGMFCGGHRAQFVSSEPDGTDPRVEAHQDFLVAVGLGAESVRALRTCIDGFKSAEGATITTRAGVPTPETAPILPLVPIPVMIDAKRFRDTASSFAGLDFLLAAPLAASEWRCRECGRGGELEGLVPYCPAHASFVCSTSCWNAHQLSQHSGAPS